MSNHYKFTIIEHISSEKSIYLTNDQLKPFANILFQTINLSSKDQTLTIGLYMQRSALQVAAIMALLSKGTRFFNLNFKYPVPYLVDIFLQCQPDFLFIDQYSLLKVVLSLELFPKNTKFVYLAQEEISHTQQHSLAKINRQYSLDVIFLDQTLSDSTQSPQPFINPNGSCLLFTSGSTGIPKGVLISNQDLQMRVQSEVKSYGLSSSDRLLNLLPFSFDVGFNQLLSACSSGATLVILNSWFQQDIYQAIIHYKITGISAVPMIWNDLLSLPPAQLNQISQQLRYLAISGGDLTQEQLQSIAKHFNHNQIYKTYGQTETFRSTLLFPHEFHQKMCSVGKPVSGTNVMVINQTHQPAKPFETGEIVHQGLGSMIEYWKDEESTNKKIRKLKTNQITSSKPFIFTGDLGYFDDDGYLYIVGRKDGMLKIQGTRIYPQEIAVTIKKLSAIHEAVVVGIHDSDDNISLYALVQLAENQYIEPEDIIQHTRKYLPALMIPKQVFLVDHIPRTINGKIDLTAVSDYIKHSTDTMDLT